MPYLIAPGQQAEQPQLSVPLNPDHWLTKDATLAINCATPKFNSATGGALAMTPGGTGFSLRGTAKGTALWTPDGGWADLSVNEDWLGPNTVIALCRVNGVDTWGGVFSKDSSGSSTQFAVGQENSTGSLYGAVENGTAVSFGGASIPALANFSVIAFTHSGVASSAMSYYRNGALVGSTTALGAQNSGTGVLGLGRSRDSSASFDSDVDWVGFIRVRRVLSVKEIAEISRNIWAPWEYLPIYWFFPVAVGGTTYNQSTGGSITVAGALTKQTGKSLSGISTPAGTLTRLISKSFGGSITSAGNIVKLTQRALTGSITGTGNLATMILFTASLDGSITPSGAISKMTIKALAGASTLAGAISKMTAKGLGGELTMVGALAKLTARALSGSVTAAGAVATSYQVLKSLAGSITPTGALGVVYIAFVAGVLKLMALMGIGQ